MRGDTPLYFKIETRRTDLLRRKALNVNAFRMINIEHALRTDGISTNRAGGEEPTV